MSFAVQARTAKIFPCKDDMNLRTYNAAQARFLATERDMSGTLEHLLRPSELQCILVLSLHISKSKTCKV